MERKIETMRDAPHWSYSAFQTYLTCPVRYYFRYIEHAEVERTSISIPFGRAFHAVLSERAMKGADYTIEDVFQSQIVSSPPSTVTRSNSPTRGFESPGTSTLNASATDFTV